MSNDATCPNCGADNLDDYPVCAACALKCHFPARETCRHCAAAALVPEMLELLRDVRQYVADANLRSDGYAEIDLKAIDALLAKIEGGPYE